MIKHFLALALTALCSSGALAQQSDAALRRVRELDAVSRGTTGKLQMLSANEHLSRAETYSSNRLFPEAREHWSIVFDSYPSDAGIPKALFGTARSYMWERKYDKAIDWFEKLTKNHLNTKDGREGLAFKGASYVRMGKNLDAARSYEQYITLFPQGERIESAHLNVIDAYREAGKYDDASRWIDHTIQRFRGKPSEVNAYHARLRMEIYRENWSSAINAADELLSGKSFAGTMAGVDEVKYLKAFALQKLSKGSNLSVSPFESVAFGSSSYYGGLAQEKRFGPQLKTLSDMRPGSYSDYPVLYAAELLKNAKKHNIDPRFLLAIMKQESSFKPNAKSPAGARGLLQLVFDTAVKYNKKAGYPSLQPDDLYKPAVSIAIGSVYVAELKKEFDGLYEAVAASYNGGEDNAVRWLNRSKPKDAGIFASEIGFAETKNYVFKVMNNYRVYRQLYSEELLRK